MDETTPEIGTVAFERVTAVGCKACAAYVMGLPEKPMKELVLRECLFSFDPEAEPMIPAMALNVEACCRRGVIAKYLEKLTMHQVFLVGFEGEPLETTEVQEMNI